MEPTFDIVLKKLPTIPKRKVVFKGYERKPSFQIQGKAATGFLFDLDKYKEQQHTPNRGSLASKRKSSTMMAMYNSPTPKKGIPYKEEKTEIYIPKNLD